MNRRIRIEAAVILLIGRDAQHSRNPATRSYRAIDDQISATDDAICIAAGE